MLVNNNIPSKPRGSFIVLEGVDRCGKTTQTGLLMKRFLAAGIAACTMRFPDRSTATGKIIDSYLKESSTISDQAIHLLFSANRWEAVSTLTSHLNQGTTVICDRYAYSGVAFSSAKVDANGKSILSREWCQSPDVGLPAPDCVLFLDLTQEQAEKRGGYGGERYEKKEMQQRVRKCFGELKEADDDFGNVPWKMIDASQSVEEVEQRIWNAIEGTISKVNEGKPLFKMWDKAEFHLNQEVDKEN